MRELCSLSAMPDCFNKRLKITGLAYRRQVVNLFVAILFDDLVSLTHACLLSPPTSSQVCKMTLLRRYRSIEKPLFQMLSPPILIER